MRLVHSVAVIAVALHIACAPQPPGTSEPDAARPHEDPSVDSGGSIPTDAGSNDAGSRDAGLFDCYPQAVEWINGDAGCGRATILYFVPSSEPRPSDNAIDVNDRGTVVFRGGSAEDQFTRVVLWRDGGIEQLPEIDALQFAVPLGLGPNDEIFGRVEGNERKGFVRWPDGGVQLFVNVDVSTGWYFSNEVIAVNARGQILKEGPDWGGKWELITDGIAIPIPNPSEPDGGLKLITMNDDGVVVGGFGFGAGTPGKPFVWSLDGGLRSDVANGCSDGAAHRITNDGIVLIKCGCPQLWGDPLLYDLHASSVRQLGGILLPDLWIGDMNDRGWVVATEPPIGRSRGVLLRNGGRCVLEDMLPPDAGLYIDGAGRLNNTGLVIAAARVKDGGTTDYSIILRIDDEPDGGH